MAGLAIFTFLLNFLKIQPLSLLLKGIGFLALLFLFGIFIQKYSSRYISDNQRITEVLSAEGISGIIISESKETAKTTRYLLRVEQIKKGDKTIDVNFKTLLYLKKSDVRKMLEYGDLVYINNSPKRIVGPKNPESFDYASFMRRKGFLFQVFTESSDVLILEKDKGSPIIKMALKIRNYFQFVLKDNISNPDNLHVAQALILGQKDDLPNEVREAFADAGAIHVLAVSGLHVGIIYQILIYLLSFLNKLKYGRQGLFFITVTVLFAYAAITGFSPSVSRAVIMFSTLALSKLINRRSDIYNNLALAAFIILIIDPMMIFDLGFQLSFLAVFSIVFFYPYFTNRVEFSNSMLDKMYKLSAVSLAAQIGTVPITLYYFHQFPNLFILSNFIVIPFAGIILSLGIALLAFHFLVFIKSIIAYVLDLSISILNKSVFIIQELPYSVSKALYFDQWQFVISLLILTSFVLILRYRQKRFAYLLLIFISCFGGYQWYLNYLFSNQKEMILFSEKDNDFVALVNGKNLQIDIDTDQMEQSNFWKYSLSAYSREKGIEKITSPQSDFFKAMSSYDCWFYDDLILVKPKKKIEFSKDVDYLIIDSLNAKMVLQSNFNPIKGFILGNNIPYFIRLKIIKELKEKNKAFHDLRSEGALVLK
ncbi:ComEC family competence protein [Hyphobacterium sp. CCMP332]|nr:ComEC family competence protein [Hyphobacterium sp. CCMP332]